MSDAPDSIKLAPYDFNDGGPDWAWSLDVSDIAPDEHLYIRADIHEAERALNAELVAALKGACDGFERLADETECDPVVRDAATSLWRAAIAKAEAREKANA